ncbi:hypothetical protein Btru_051083 [Bulinus truncatus]|nr:hypothetical protein Btru_051083 [Bulinus truncatus]
MGQQISAAAESAGHLHAHLAAAEVQGQMDSVEPGKPHQRRSHWTTPASSQVPAKSDGLGQGEKNFSKTDQEIGRMSIRAAIDSFIENCLSSSNEFPEKNGGDDVESLNVLEKLNEDSRALRNSERVKSGAKSSDEHSQSGAESISSESTDIQETEPVGDDGEESQLVIDCDGSSETKIKDEPKEANLDITCQDKLETGKEPAKDAEHGKKYSPSRDKQQSFSMYLQDHIKKSVLDQQEDLAPMAHSKDLQSHSQIIMWEMAKKPTGEGPCGSGGAGTSDLPQGPVRLQTLIDKVLDKSLNNQNLERSAHPAEHGSYYHKSKKGESKTSQVKEEDKPKEVIVATGSKDGSPKDGSPLGKKDTSLTCDIKDNPHKQPAKNTLCFKDHIEKVLLESFLSYEEEERRDAVKRGENPEEVSKPKVQIETDSERLSTKKEQGKSGADGTISVQDIVDRVISQTEVISKLLTPSTSDSGRLADASQPHPPLKQQSVSTHNKALLEAQRFTVEKEHHRSNIGRKRGRPRLGSPGIWAPNDPSKDKSGYPDQRTRDRGIQGTLPVPHHLSQQLPHMPTHQERHGAHPRAAPPPVDYPLQSYSLPGMSAPPSPAMYQHQRPPGNNPSPTSKSGLPPNMGPSSSVYHQHGQEPFHPRGSNLPQQQARNHQHLGHSKPPPPLILADNISEKNNMSRMVPVSHMPTKSCSCHACVSHFSQAPPLHSGQKPERSVDPQGHYLQYQSASRHNISHSSGSALTMSGQSPFSSHSGIPNYVSGHRQHDGPPSGQQPANRDTRYYDNKGRNPSPGHYPAYNSQLASRQETRYSDNNHMSSRQDSRYSDNSQMLGRQDSRYAENFSLPGRQDPRYSDNSQVPSRDIRYSNNGQHPGRQETRYPENSHIPRHEARYPDSSLAPARPEVRYPDHIPRHLEPYDLTDSVRSSRDKKPQAILVDAASPVQARLAEVPAHSEGDQPLDLSVKPGPSLGKDLRTKPSEEVMELAGHDSRQSFRNVSSELPPGGAYLEYDQRAPAGHHLQRLESSVDRFLPQNPHSQYKLSPAQPAPVDVRDRHGSLPLPDSRERHASSQPLLHPPESPSHKGALGIYRHALPSPSLLPSTSSQNIISASASPVAHPYASKMSPGDHHRPDSSPVIHHFHTTDPHLKQPDNVVQRPSSHNSDIELRLMPPSLGARSPSPDEAEAQRMGVSKHEPIQNIIGSHPPSDILYLICRLCRQTYGSPYGFRKHFRNQHGFEPKAEHTIVQTISATKNAMANSGPTSDIHTHSPVVEDGGYEDNKRDLAAPSNLIPFDDMKLDIKGENTKYLECPECQQLFRLNDFGSYKRHCRQHSLHGPFACHECQKCFSDPGLLQEHLETHSTLSASVCTICQNYFSSPIYLAEHIQTAHLHVYPGEKTDKSLDNNVDATKRTADGRPPRPDSLPPPSEVNRQTSAADAGSSSSQARITSNHLPLTKRHRQFSPAGDAQMFTVHTPKGLEVEKLPADGVVTTASPDSSYDDCQPGSAGIRVDTPAADSESSRSVSGTVPGVKAGLTKTPSSEAIRSHSKDDTESNSSDCSATMESQSADGSQGNGTEDVDKFYKHKKYSRYRKRSSPTGLTEPDKKVAKVDEKCSSQDPGVSVTSSVAVTSTVNSGVTLQDCESSCQHSEDSNSSSCFKSPGDDLKKQVSTSDKVKTKGDDREETKTGSDDPGTKFKWDRLTRSQAGKAAQSVSYTSS